MDSSRGHPVSIQIASLRGMAAVHTRLPIARVPASFRQYLDQVYAAARSGAITVDGQNIFVYHGGLAGNEDADVEFGVGVAAPFAPVGNVEYTELPVGEAAMTTHWGDYSGLRSAHGAVIDWCRANQRTRTGTRWEVYGHWSDDPAKVRTDVYHLLARS